VPESDELSSHPRFQEWLQWCTDQHTLASKAQVPEGTLRLPSFRIWLREQEKQTEAPQQPAPDPRIRTENPPISSIVESNRLNASVDKFYNTFIVIGVLSIIVLIVLHFVDEQYSSPTFVVILWVGAAWFVYSRCNTREKLAAEKLLPLPAHIYNREYTGLFDDGSTLKTNIFFTLPQSCVHLDSQLDTFTEKEFLIFVAMKTAPPSAAEIQDHLSQKLLPFQNENLIPFLRVEVSLNIHLSAPKPKGGGSVSV
jgi:hypothetical protein